MWNQRFSSFSEKCFLKISISFLLFLIAENVNAQNDMKVHLKEGCGTNPTIQIDSLMIEPANLYCQPRPWNTQSPSIQLEMNILDGNDSYQSFLYYYEESNNPIRCNLPKGIGNHLFSLDVGEDSVDLLIETLDLGDIFTFDLKNKKGVVIEGLVITYDSGYIANDVNPDGSYAGYTVSHSLKLFDGSEKGMVTFSYDSNEGNAEVTDTKVWKGFQLELISLSNEFLTLKVSRTN